MKSLIVIAAAILALAGCGAATWDRMKDNRYVGPRWSYRFAGLEGWLEYSSSNRNMAVFAKDHPSLQRITVEVRPLDEAYPNLKRKASATDRPQEIGEMLATDLRTGNKEMELLQVQSLRPQQVSGINGIALTGNWFSSTGLEYRLAVSAFIKDEELYVISFYAPRRFYFERDFPAYQSVVSTFEAP